jgi:L-seryl-tRNA(Ser) seleniumtransferase
MAGKDPAKIAQLPEVFDQKNEIIVHRFQRNHYDNNVRTAGGRFVEIGHHRTTHLWELRAAIGPRTAAILYFAGPYEAQNLLSLEQVLAVASNANVPVIVDAAAQIPPAENLWGFTRMGADLVLFSGGKTLGGPQNTGLIVGKRELVDACVLLASPNYAIGRPMKVGKEEMIGLLAAIEFYLERGEREQRERCENWSSLLADGLSGLHGVFPRRQFPNFKRQPLPEVVADFDEISLGVTRDEIVHRLAAGNPRIEVALHGSTGITINPDPLKDGEVDIVIARLRDVISDRSSPR